MSILDKLKENNIVDFELKKNNTEIAISEACDYYYEYNLSKEEFKQLIDELTELYNSMSSKND